MNQRYVFRYLEDPKDAFGELNDPARVQMIVNKDLPKDNPVTYAFMGALTLDKDQLNDLESTINEVGEPLEGARRWSEDNSEVWQPLVQAAENARES
jgi:glycine betaine/proline transport system substrate-binding protein